MGSTTVHALATSPPLPVKFTRDEIGLVPDDRYEPLPSRWLGRQNRVCIDIGREEGERHKLVALLDFNSFAHGGDYSTIHSRKQEKFDICPNPRGIIGRQSSMADSDNSTSWWLTDFEARLPEAQARMRRELRPAAVEEYFEDLLKQEEAELLLRRKSKRRRDTTVPRKGTTVPRKGTPGGW